ncbi:MAG: hypothetical protein WC399_03825 [Bacilli bacterium]|jgi:hypothetical protein
MKKVLMIFAGIAISLVVSACGSSLAPSNSSEPVTSGASSGSETSSISSSSISSGDPEPVYGLPTPETGFYMKDADVIEEANGDRLLVYVTNAESGEEDDVIAIRRGVFSSGNGYLYGEEHVILTPSVSGWDQYIGGPAIIKGEFSYDTVAYSYLLAYHGTDLATGMSNSIGVALATDPLGTWVKVSDVDPAFEYDAAVYGETYLGFHAPSLINLDQESIIRLFWTWADAYGHYTYFLDIDLSDLSTAEPSGFAMVPNNGNLSSGDLETMIPNADFAYDGTGHDLFMVKDYSPAASQLPRVSTRIELAKIAEEELYTTDQGDGWESLGLFVFLDTPEGLYERLYSGTIVADEYGHVLSTSSIEIIYNISELEADTPNYLFTQRLATILYTAA